MLKKRETWQEEVMKLDPNDLIFIDESGANYRMALQYARAKGGARIKMAVPCNRGAQISLIGAISTQGVEAALYGEWATDGDIFHAFIEDYLAPKLRAGHIVIMDNVRFHYRKDVTALIESKGARVLFLPPYSPDFSPIENMWSKIKGILRKFFPRSLAEFQEALKNAFEAITDHNLLSWFKHCGYNT
jgi:transposase